MQEARSSNRALHRPPRIHVHNTSAQERGEADETCQIVKCHLELQGVLCCAFLAKCRRLRTSNRRNISKSVSSAKAMHPKHHDETSQEHISKKSLNLGFLNPGLKLRKLQRQREPKARRKANTNCQLMGIPRAKGSSSAGP